MNDDVNYNEIAEAEGKKHKIFLISIASGVIVFLIAMALLWGPLVRPWSQERKGMANLAQAKFENQIRAEKSGAEAEAAVLRAQAIAIVGDVAKQYPEYREQEFIGAFAKALENGQIGQTFYIPTTGTIPVLPGTQQ